MRQPVPARDPPSPELRAGPLPPAEDAAARTPDDPTAGRRGGDSAGTGDRAESPARSAISTLRGALDLVGMVAAPPALIAALAFYIGTVRQASLAGYFGLQTGVLGLSTQDYVLRSTAALVPFLIGLALVGLAAAAIVALAGAWLRHQPPRVRDGLAGAALCVGLVGMGIGVWRLSDPVPLRSAAYLLGPASMSAGVILVGAAAARLLDAGLLGLRLSSRMRLLATISAVVLVLVSVFWAANDYARAQGVDEAVALASDLRLRLPAAVVYSADRLRLGADGIEEEELADAVAGEERFRYRGLRLLLRSGGYYVLIPGGWTRADGTVVVLPEDSVRVEFRPGGTG